MSESAPPLTSPEWERNPVHIRVSAGPSEALPAEGAGQQPQRGPGGVPLVMSSAEGVGGGAGFDGLICGGLILCMPCSFVAKTLVLMPQDREKGITRVMKVASRCCPVTCCAGTILAAVLAYLIIATPDWSGDGLVTVLGVAVGACMLACLACIGVVRTSPQLMGDPEDSDDEV